MRHLLAALLSCSAACSTTTYAPVGTSNAQRWLAKNAGTEVSVQPVIGGDPARVVIEARSLTDIQFRATDGGAIAIADIRKVVVVSRPVGALEGALLGTAAGASLGLIYGWSRALSSYERSMDCTIICSNADAAKWEALFLSVPGLLIGAAIGAIVGDRDTLELR